MKKTVAIILAAVLAVSLVSCYKFKQPQKTDIDNTEITNTDNPSGGPQDPPEEPPKTETQQEIPLEEPVAKTAEIIYNGRVDMNFIEVSFDDGEYGIMRLSEDLQDSFDSLKIAEGAKINVSYTEKDGQKTITEIKK